MFKKQLNILFVATLITVFLFGLGLNGCAPKEPGRYYNKDKGFSIRFPEEWERKKGVMGATINALAPQESPTDEFREIVSVFVEQLPEGVNLQEYFRVSLVNARKMVPDFQEHESGQTAINHSDAKWLIYSSRMAGVNMKALLYLLVKGRRGYTIGCTAALDQFSKYKAKFEEIAQSFKFE